MTENGDVAVKRGQCGWHKEKMCSEGRKEGGWGVGAAWLLCGKPPVHSPVNDWSCHK